MPSDEWRARREAGVTALHMATNHPRPFQKTPGIQTSARRSTVRGNDERRCCCHNEPMERNPGSGGGWRCVVKRRERQLTAYHTDPVAANYARDRRRLRQRIRENTVRLVFATGQLRAFVERYLGRQGADALRSRLGD